MLKTFVLAETISTVSNTGSTSNTAAASQAAKNAQVTDTSYSDGNISVTLTEKTVNETQVYVADITLSSSDYLKTALAQNSYGTNVTAKTSVTAAENNAILAVNGDYYGANSSGYVIRNGVVYRDSVREDASNGDLAIYKDGSFKIIYEDQVSADQLVQDGVVNLLAFGPSLVENGEISVEKARNPVCVSDTATPVCSLNKIRVKLFPKRLRKGTLPVKARTPRTSVLGFSFDLVKLRKMSQILC